MSRVRFSPAPPSRARTPLTTWAIGRLLVVATITGLLWGVVEGALYPSEGGPRIPLSTYWSLLVVGLVTTSLGLAMLLDRQPLRAFLMTLTFLPLALVIQDSVSLLLQGKTPMEATWYAAVLGDGPHTRHDPFFGLPGGYWMLLVLSFGCLGLLVAGERRAQRRLGAEPTQPAAGP